MYRRGIKVFFIRVCLHVNLRKNHHVIIYKNSKNEYSEDVVSFWEAVRRERLKQPIYAIPEEDSEFVTTLAINDLFLLGIHDLNDTLKNESRSFLIRHLYRVQKLSSYFYETLVNVYPKYFEVVKKEDHRSDEF